MATYPVHGQDPWDDDLKTYIDDTDTDVGDVAAAALADYAAEHLTTTALLTGTEANSTVTPAVLTGHTFLIPPGQTLRLSGLLVFRTAATTTGAAYGVRVTQPAGASAKATGAVTLDVAVDGAAVASGLRLGDNFDVAAAANSLVEIVGTGVSSTSVDHVAQAVALIKNQAAAHSTTVTVEFRSEVAASAVTAQIGTAAVGTIT